MRRGERARSFLEANLICRNLNRSIRINININININLQYIIDIYIYISIFYIKACLWDRGWL